MLGLPLHYLLRNPVVGMAVLASDPVQVWTTVQENYLALRERRGPQCTYQAEPDWEMKLHRHLGAPWPCPLRPEFDKLWSQVVTELEDKGIRPGPQSFDGSWNDGDAGFVRALFCLARHIRPSNVIETGVAHGFTSRFVLEALAANDNGHLYSIDLPPIEKFWQSEVGVAVGGRFPHRWSYIKGSSRRHLPRLLASLPQIDIFIHDSLHSERNVRFELDRAWAKVRPGGALVVDDVDANWGFRSFTENFAGHQSMICEAEPLRPDMRRFNQKGLFGILLKEPTANV